MLYWLEEEEGEEGLYNSSDVTATHGNSVSLFGVYFWIRLKCTVNAVKKYRLVAGIGRNIGLIVIEKSIIYAPLL